MAKARKSGKKTVSSSRRGRRLTKADRERIANDCLELEELDQRFDEANTLSPESLSKPIGATV